MPDRKSGPPRGPSRDEPAAPVNESRRSMFRLFTRPLAALAPTPPPPPPGATTGSATAPALPPVRPGFRRVLRDDARAPFLALIEKFASGVPLDGGFKVLGLQIGRDVVEVRWQRPRENFVTVFVSADRELDASHAPSALARTFRIIVTGGTAPPEAIATALAALAAEVARTDRGDLWIDVPV